MNMLLADATSRVTYEFGRLQNYTERWHYLVLALVCAAVLAFVVTMYRRDSVELRRGVGVLLLVLRVSALLGLLVYYLDLEKRTERKVVHNSRVILLVDDTLSMGLHDSDSSSVPQTPNRLQQVVSVLEESKLINNLRARHEVVIMRFDSETNRVASLGKLPTPGVSTSTANSADEAAEPNEKKPAATKPEAKAETVIDWKTAILPQGAETRLGQSLKQVIGEQRGTPVAGIVVFSDGGQNAGIDPSAAIAAAREAKVPVYTVGIGSDRRPVNVRVSDFVAPARAYPGDSFAVTGYLQSHELADRVVTVELFSKPAGGSGEGQLEGTERVTLGPKGEVIPVKFEITPNEKGRRTYRLRVKAPPEDTDETDNQQEADVEIVDRQTKILLIASGPTREYIFLRNQLRRDKSMVVDVILQSAKQGISQDANKILDEFPSTPQELFEYDAIVAFDPNWEAMDSDDVDLLERWVAEKAGGLIVIAGPVEMDRWVQDPKQSKLRGLYPVEFNRRLSVLEDGRFGSEIPAPVDFSREGLEAEFLWLGDTSAKSQTVWSSFPGVYGYYAIRSAKPGATVFARYSDPQAGALGEQPVYMAEHFYGSGRVFYLGSGEMWRLRALDDSYFEQIYTKLVRHVSQGRLLVGSSHGMLLVDRDRYLLGNTVVLRAQLSGAQFEPVDLPNVPLQIIRPDSTIDTLQMAADPTRKGMYAGQFTALQEGTYRLELPVPDTDDEMLSRRIQVKVPDLERENPQRNDALLSEIAKRTGGLYYVGAESVLGTKGVPALASQLESHEKVTYLAGVTDQQFDFRWMRGLLFFISGVLCLEWLIRRLAKLA